MALRSGSLKTATHSTPMRLAVRMIRHAISPRLAMRIFLNIPGTSEACARDERGTSEACARLGRSRASGWLTKLKEEKTWIAYVDRDRSDS